MGVTSCRWFLDRPVSNSGRLRKIITDVAAKFGWNWEVELEMNPDKVLMECALIVSTGDSAILDRCSSWFNLARVTIEKRIPEAWLVNLSES